MNVSQKQTNFLSTCLASKGQVEETFSAVIFNTGGQIRIDWRASPQILFSYDFNSKIRTSLN